MRFDVLVFNVKVTPHPRQTETVVSYRTASPDDILFLSFPAIVTENTSDNTASSTVCSRHQSRLQYGPEPQQCQENRLTHSVVQAVDRLRSGS